MVRRLSNAGDCQLPERRDYTRQYDNDDKGRSSVAKSEFTPATPTFAKMAVNAAKQADSRAQTCHMVPPIELLANGLEDRAEQRPTSK